MHAPLVLAAAAGARAVDDDLACPHRHRELRGRARSDPTRASPRPSAGCARTCGTARSARTPAGIIARSCAPTSGSYGASTARCDAGVVRCHGRHRRSSGRLCFAFRSARRTVTIRFPKRNAARARLRCAIAAPSPPPHSPAAAVRGSTARPAAHGRPRPARPALGAARAVGAPRRAARLPRPPGGVRRMSSSVLRDRLARAHRGRARRPRRRPLHAHAARRRPRPGPGPLDAWSRRWAAERSRDEPRRAWRRQADRRSRCDALRCAP